MSNVNLRNKVVEANKDLLRKGLVIQTWGNASAIDRETNQVLIKPSGVSFENLEPENISAVDLRGDFCTGLKPSVDTPTHIEIYKGFEKVRGVVHTHSLYATIFAQAEVPIPCLGTTHADYFCGEIPVIPEVRGEELEKYEANTGKKIVAYFRENQINPAKMPATLIAKHGAFTWGESIEQAIENAVILEYVAELAYKTLTLAHVQKRTLNPLDHDLLEKHFSRKHGPKRYYGQQ